MARSLPAMIKFYKAHTSERDRFEFLAFHDTRAKTFAELDEKMAEREVAEKHWDGEQLPFPILLDASGKTIRHLDVRAFPTTIVIDPEGKLRGAMSLDGFERLLHAGSAEGQKAGGSAAEKTERGQR